MGDPERPPYVNRNSPPDHDPNPLPTSSFRARPGDRALVVRAVLGGAAMLALVAVGMALPHPGALTVREWAQSLGPWFPAAFLAAHVAVTVLPIPRTIFTMLAGFLFGPVLGIAVCMTASTVAAVIAFAVVRHLDRRHRSAVLDRIRAQPAYAAIAARLRERGWLAVGALRLIAVMPFSILNYASALSPVRFGPFLAATIVGLAPGTCAVVILGDALTGESSPWQVLISAGLLVVGVLGLLLDARMPVHPAKH